MKFTFKRLIILLLFIAVFPVTVFLLSPQGSLSPELNDLKKTLGKIVQPKDSLVSNAPIAIHHWTTQKGTPVYFVPTEGLPMVDIVVTLNAGSARDGNKLGLAALLASLLEEGTQNHSAEAIAQQFEGVGAIFHKEVDRDRMQLSLRSLTEPTALSPAVGLFSEVLTKPALTNPSIEQIKNQTLVALKRELQQPGKIAAKTFLHGIYKDHPYGHPVSGNLDSVSSITSADLVQFHQTYFVSDNAIITIVGGLDRDSAKNLAEKIAHALPNGKKAPPLPEVAPLTAGAENRIAFPSQQAHILLGQPCCTALDPDYFPLLVGNYILGEGTFVARLFKEVREKRGLTYSIKSHFSRWQKPGPFMINLQTQTSQVPEAIQVLKDTLVHFVKEGPTDEELLAAKKGIIGGFPLSIGDNAQIAKVLSELTFYGLPLNFLETFQTQVDKVTQKDVKRAFEQRLDPNKMLLVVVGE